MTIYDLPSRVSFIHTTEKLLIPMEEIRHKAYLNAYLDFSSGPPKVVDVRIQGVPGHDFEPPELPNACGCLLTWRSATTWEEARDYIFESITAPIPGNRLAWVQDWFPELQEEADEPPPPPPPNSLSAAAKAARDALTDKERAILDARLGKPKKVDE